MIKQKDGETCHEILPKVEVFQVFFQKMGGVHRKGNSLNRQHFHPKSSSQISTDQGNDSCNVLIFLNILPLVPSYKFELNYPVPPPLRPMIVLNQRFYHNPFGTQPCDTSLDSLVACCGLQCIHLPFVRPSGRG